jgi:hypothetical protein
MMTPASAAASAPDSIASGSGAPCFAVMMVTYAPHMMNSPCARLMTPIMPKITARPSAASTRYAKLSPN